MSQLIIKVVDFVWSIFDGRLLYGRFCMVDFVWSILYGRFCMVDFVWSIFDGRFCRRVTCCPTKIEYSSQKLIRMTKENEN